MDRLFGFKISGLGFRGTIEWIKDKVAAKDGGVIFCCTLNEMRSGSIDKRIKFCLDKADLLVPDGMPLVWYQRLKCGSGERVYGPDLMDAVLLETKNRKHFFLGSTTENLGLIKKRLVVDGGFKSKNVETYSPRFKAEFSEDDIVDMVKKIEGSNADIVWVGLGAEKQITLATELRKHLKNVILITVGAAFDFFAGTKKQAPRWLRSIGGEWLFRLVNEPKRLIKRYGEILLFLVINILNKLKAWLLFTLLSLVLISPQLLVKYPGLIDDGSDLLYVRDIGWWKIITDQLSNGQRLWFLRLIYRKILYEMFGLNMQGHFVVGGILLGTICFLLYLIVKRASKNKSIAMLLVTFFLMSPPSVANFYRLGTGEPLQLLLLLLALLASMDKKHGQSLCLLILCLFTKETAVFFLVVFLFYLLLKRSRLLIVGLLILAIYITLIIRIYSMPGAVYIRQSFLSFGLLERNFNLTKLYIGVELLTFFVLIVSSLRHSRRSVNRLWWLLGLMISSNVFLIFWPMPNDFRYSSYYFLLMAGLNVISLGAIIGNLPGYWRKIWCWVIVISILPVLFDSFLTARFWHERSIADGAMAGYLMNNNLSKTDVFSAINGLERNNKVYLYANEWGNRSKSFLPTMSSWVDTYGDSNSIRRIRLANESIDKFIRSGEKDRILVSDHELRLSDAFVVEPVCGNSLFGKLCDFFVYRPL